MQDPLQDREVKEIGKELIQESSEIAEHISYLQTDQVPEKCCSTPECDKCNCTFCEYVEVCEGDTQKIDYCPRPHTCSSCGANCLECELWQKPVYFRKLFEEEGK